MSISLNTQKEQVNPAKSSELTKEVSKLTELVKIQMEMKTLQAEYARKDQELPMKNYFTASSALTDELHGKLLELQGRISRL